jgi:hypothetical protein
MINSISTTYSMTAYSYSEETETNDIQLSKTLVDADVTDLSEMFLSFLLVNGFTWAKGVSIITDSGEEHTTDDFFSHEFWRSGPDDADVGPDVSWEFSYGEQPEAEFQMQTSFQFDDGYRSINAATPEEWNKAANFANKPN